MTRWSDHEIDEAKDRIEGLLAQRLKLKKAGHELRGECPYCRHRKQRFFVIPKKRMFHCFNCQKHGTAIDFARDHLGAESFGHAVAIVLGREPEGEVDPAEEARRAKQRADRDAEAQAEVRQRRTDAWALWRRCGPAAGTLVETYWHAARGIRIPLDLRIRFHPSLGWRDDAQDRVTWRGPAMVCAMRYSDGVFAGVHRTWLALDGKDKAPLSPDRRMLGPTGGAGIWLGTDDAVRGAPDLVVGEGVETTASVCQAAGWPGIAAGSTSHMAGLRLPGDGKRNILIFRDPGEPGLIAARAAAARWTADGHRVRIAHPTDADGDGNDILRRYEVAA